MKICSDVLKRSSAAMKKNKPSKFQVVDTSHAFWGQINKSVAEAKIFDVTSLLSSVSDGAQYANRFERCVEFGDMSPNHYAMWVEAVDTCIPANLAALLVYVENSNCSDLADQAKHYGFNRPFKWICQARCFIKKQYAQVLPLKWEWIEYINDRGESVGSLLQPIFFPEYIDRTIAEELDNIGIIHPYICAFLANLGFYTVDLINNNKVTLTERVDRQFNYYVLNLN